MASTAKIKRWCTCGKLGPHLLRGRAWLNDLQRRGHVVRDDRALHRQRLVGGYCLLARLPAHVAYHVALHLLGGVAGACREALLGHRLVPDRKAQSSHGYTTRGLPGGEVTGRPDLEGNSRAMEGWHSPYMDTPCRHSSCPRSEAALDQAQLGPERKPASCRRSAGVSCEGKVSPNLPCPVHDPHGRLLLPGRGAKRVKTALAELRPLCRQPPAHPCTDLCRWACISVFQSAGMPGSCRMSPF